MQSTSIQPRDYAPTPSHAVAFLGLGVMGYPMAAHLLAAGHQVTVYNRTAAKAEALAAELAPHLHGCALTGGGLHELASTTAFDVVINATSASLGGDTPAVPTSAFAAGALAYDMVYGKGLTPFLRLAQSAGAARLADGVGMLVEQAAEAFAWWRGVRPDTRAALARLTVPLV